VIAHIYISENNTSLEQVLSHHKDVYKITSFSEMYIRPLEEKKELVLEQIQEFRKLLRYTYTNIFIVGIEGMDRSGVEVQNTLLKTLEEHQPTVHILIKVGNIHSLVPTVISRCKVVDISENKGESEKRDNFVDTHVKLTVNYVDSYLIDKSKKAKTIDELRFLLQYRQLLLNNNVAPQTVYDSVLNFYKKQDSISM